MPTNDEVRSVEYEICEACNGTGIEEGMDWSGERCRSCFGVRVSKPRPVKERAAATLCHCGDLNCEDHPS